MMKQLTFQYAHNTADSIIKPIHHNLFKILQKTHGSVREELTVAEKVKDFLWNLIIIWHCYNIKNIFQR